MTQEDLKAILKYDLQISTEKLDNYLTALLSAARSLIVREGIRLNIEGDTEDGMLVVMYAAYLYRKRGEKDTAMPRMLRYALNNRALSHQEKGGGTNG